MPLESATYLNDLVITNPASGDIKGEGDDHLRLIKKALKNTFPNLGAVANRVVAKSANYTILPTDSTAFFDCTSGLTLSLTAAATLGAGHVFGVYADGNVVIIDPAGTELINGVTSVSIASGTWGYIYCTGTSFLFLKNVPLDISQIYPIGSLYFNGAVGTNPATLLGFGTWVAHGAGRALVSLDAGNALMDTVGETFGSADSIVPQHNHTITDPGHTHSSIRSQARLSINNIFAYWFGTGGEGTSGTITTDSNTTGITIANAGVSAVNQNYQPSIAVYIWRRTA